MNNTNILMMFNLLYQMNIYTIKLILVQNGVAMDMVNEVCDNYKQWYDDIVSACTMSEYDNELYNEVAKQLDILNTSVLSKYKPS